MAIELMIDSKEVTEHHLDNTGIGSRLFDDVDDLLLIEAIDLCTIQRK
jgi:hypothetical protein